MTEPTLGFDGSRFDPSAKAICDLCLGPDVLWAFPVTDFAQLPGEDNSGWAACDRCAALIEDGDVTGLVQRCAKPVARRNGVSRREAERTLDAVYRRFIRARGVRVASDGTIKDPTRAEADPKSEAEWKQMLSLEGDKLRLEIVGSNLDPDKTFSAPALEAVKERLSQFIGSRIVRKWGRTQVAPHNLAVDITVTLDGETFEAGGTQMLMLPDSRHKEA